jgi:hypothetical protein
VTDPDPDPVADAARAAAQTLAPGLSLGLPAQVEAALAARHAGEQRPDRYDPAAIAGLGISAASLIVTIAQLAWTIITSHPQPGTPPPPETIARQIRITLRQHDTPLPPGTEHITDIVITEITRHTTPPAPSRDQADR